MEQNGQDINAIAFIIVIVEDIEQKRDQKILLKLTTAERIKN
jgi:hypothetical protein